MASELPWGSRELWRRFRCQQRSFLQNTQRHDNGGNQRIGLPAYYQLFLRSRGNIKILMLLACLVKQITGIFASQQPRSRQRSSVD